MFSSFAFSIKQYSRKGILNTISKVVANIVATAAPGVCNSKSVYSNIKTNQKFKPTCAVKGNSFRSEEQVFVVMLLLTIRHLGAPQLVLVGIVLMMSAKVFKPRYRPQA